MADTTPTESDSVLPNGLPIAATGCADDDTGGVAERHRVERVQRRVDLDEPDVVEEVPADDLRRHAVAVLELDVEVRAVAAVAPGLPAVVITCEFVRM